MPHTPVQEPAIDLSAATKTQVLLELYKEQCNHGRHTESQRHLVTAMFLTGAGALLTIVSYNHFSRTVWPLAACVGVLGLLGLGFARVYEIKWDEGGLRRTYYREQLEDLTGIAPVPRDFLPRGKEEEDMRRNPPFSSLRSYWRLTFLFVTGAGAIALWMCLSPQGMPS